MTFNSFSFHPAVAAGAARAGYVTPTPIQSRAIPQVMKSRDVLGLAQTGTGKTAAFVLPMLNRLIDGPQDRVRALILAPTRELAEQIHNEIIMLGSRTRLRSACVYGGVGICPQIQALKKAHIVVACPGRLLDHIGRGTIDLSRLEMLVLDEADQMFDMGFFPDIRRILTHLPAENRQTLLFSATMPDVIRALANDILRTPITVEAAFGTPAKTVRHALYPVAPHLKTALLIKLLEQSGSGSVLVFARTKFRAKRLGETLSKAGYRSASLQGNLSQGRRRAAMDGFRSGTFQILVATDIAARGIDVSRVSHVINYDIPATPEAYIHRIGRTGRAACSGDAFTLVTREDEAKVQSIHRAMGRRVAERTLADFDYDAPSAFPDSQGGGSSIRRQSTAGKGYVPSHTKSRRRSGKVAQVRMTSRKGRPTPLAKPTQAGQPIDRRHGG